MKFAAMIATVFVILTVCGCSENRDTEEDITEAYYDLNYDREVAKQEIEKFITELNSGELTLFEEGVSVKPIDVVGIQEGNRWYFSNNAIYLQNYSHMYRFQFEDSGEIGSYIKYRLEEY